MQETIVRLRRRFSDTSYQKEANDIAHKALEHHSNRLFWEKIVSGSIGLSMGIVGGAVVFLLLNYYWFAFAALALSQAVLLLTECARQKVHYEENKTQIYVEELEELRKRYRNEVG